MDWKETVMKRDDIGMLVCETGHEGTEAQRNWACFREIARTQAQITGDIAYATGEKDMYAKMSKAVGLTGIDGADEIDERLRRGGRKS